MTDLLARIETALNDWIRTDYPDVCEPERIEETQKRIQDNGGTLAYIADLLVAVRAARKDQPAAAQARGITGGKMKLPDELKASELFSANPTGFDADRFEAIVRDCASTACKYFVDGNDGSAERTILTRYGLVP